MGCSITSGTTGLTCSSAIFVAQDVGKAITVVGAGAAAADLFSTIAIFTSGTQVTLANSASTTVSGAVVRWATDNTTALTNALGAVKPTGGTVFFPYGGTGSYYMAGTPSAPNGVTGLNVTQTGVRLVGECGEPAQSNVGWVRPHRRTARLS